MREWLWRQLNHLPRSWAFWLIIAGLILSGLGMAFGWDWLRSGATEKEPNSTTIRNAGIVIAGIFALAFALWRGLVAERQAAAAQSQAETAECQAETALRQTETAQLQADTAQQGLLNERYQKGAEMLGSNVLAVRLGGIYALQRLAEEHPEQYHVQIMQLFCAYVRNPTGELEGPVSDYDDDGEPIPGLHEDIEAVMQAIGKRTEAGIVLERADENFRLYLPNANLQGGVLEELNLSGAFLHRANLSRASLRDSDLSRAFLGDSDLSGARLPSTILSSASFETADLSNAKFPFAKLDNARFFSANLTGADLKYADLTRAFFNVRGRAGTPSPAKGLTQAQLDEARSDPDNPPFLEGVLDAKTGKQLVWRGKPLEEEGE